MHQQICTTPPCSQNIICIIHSNLPYTHPNHIFDSCTILNGLKYQNHYWEFNIPSNSNITFDHNIPHLLATRDCNYAAGDFPSLANATTNVPNTAYDSKTPSESTFCVVCCLVPVLSCFILWICCEHLTKPIMLAHLSEGRLSNIMRLIRCHTSHQRKLLLFF